MKKMTFGVCCGLVTILCVFMMSIVIKMGTKNIVVEKLHVNNELTRFILQGVQTADVIDEATGDMFVQIDWEALYPFEDNTNIVQVVGDGKQIQSIGEIYTEKVTHIRNVVNDYATTYLMNRIGFVESAYRYDAVMGWKLTPSSATDGIVFLENGYLAQIHAKNDTTKIAENMENLKKYLEEKNIDFLYVQAPTKMSMTEKYLPAGMQDYANENADELIQKLQRAEISVLDLRPEMYKIAQDYYGAFYITDHHWTTTTAFQMAGVLAQYLNDEYGYAFDEKYYDITNYTVQKYENAFLGSLGKKVTLAMAEPENFELIVPDFDTDFTIQIPERKIDIRGTFEDTLLDYRHLQKIDYYYENCYAAYMNRNDATATIHNESLTSNQGKRILFIKDSYATPFIPYIALGVEYVDTLYEIRYTGSVKSYIDSIQPDLVIVMYSADNVNGDGSKKTSAFYLQ